MSNRFSQLAQARRIHGGTPCWRIRIDPELTSKRRKELDEALDDLSIPATIIVLVLTEEWGIKRVSQTMVSKHRRGGCSCPQ